jgi:hypothetical protein
MTVTAAIPDDAWLYDADSVAIRVTSREDARRSASMTRTTTVDTIHIYVPNAAR